MAQRTQPMVTFRPTRRPRTSEWAVVDMDDDDSIVLLGEGSGAALAIPIVRAAAAALATMASLAEVVALTELTDDEGWRPDSWGLSRDCYRTLPRWPRSPRRTT
jgi:hypothetical protein